MMGLMRDPYALGVGVVFLLSRFILRVLMGMRFDTSSLVWAWQLLDPGWLREDLLRSLWYLHMQPPLFNLLTAFALHLPRSSLFLDLLFLSFGLLTSILLYMLGRELGLSRTLSMVIAIVAFVLNPSSILYETWYFYTYPVLFLTSLLSLLLVRSVRRSTFRRLILALSVLTLLTLLRTSYHLILFVLVGGVMLWYLRTRWRIVLPALLLTSLPTFLWYLKNYALFGTFSPTSWTGMNLTRLVWNMPGWEEERFRELHAEGAVSSLMTVPPFSPPDTYIALLGYSKRTGVVVLDSTVKPTVGTYNYNHAVYVEVSRVLLRDNLKLLLRYPWAYARAALSAIKIFTYPPYAYPQIGRFHLLFDEGNLRVLGKLRVWVGTYDLLYGWFGKRLPGLTVALMLLLLVGLLPRLLRFPDTGTLAVLLLYLIAVHSLLERRENMRFRFQFEPVAVMVVAAGLLSKRNRE